MAMLGGAGGRGKSGISSWPDEAADGGRPPFLGFVSDFFFRATALRPDIFVVLL
jgi:hypothetical protein